MKARCCLATSSTTPVVQHAQYSIHLLVLQHGRQKVDGVTWRNVQRVYYMWVLVCLLAVNAKTTSRTDVKRSGIMKNDPECVLCRLKWSVLVFSERYRDISGFSHRVRPPFLLIALPLPVLAYRLPFNPPTLTELYCNIMLHIPLQDQISKQNSKAGYWSWSYFVHRRMENLSITLVFGFHGNQDGI